MSTIWTTREGERLEVKSMASSHLLATIHLIERNRFTNAVECAMHEPELNASNATMRYYLRWHESYEALVIEAQRRGLIYRGSTERKKLK